MINSNPLRIASIDVLRAFTMLLMIFVNDLWSLREIPAWLEHTAAATDGMGLADIVFPAFLFIVGMSIPLSVAQRRKKGDRTHTIIFHIMERSLALLIMGLFLVNGENINSAATGMTGNVWYMLSCFCFILIWNSWRENMNVWLKRNIKGLGIIGLFLLAWIFRGGGPENLDRFGTHWWGILGLIGWGYLVSALVYAVSGRRMIILVLAWLAFLFTCMASHAGMIPDIPLLKTIIGPLGDGAMPAFTMGGAIVTSLLLSFREKNNTNKALLLILLLAALAFAAGVYTRQFWGISKIRATPAWVLICSSITMIVFVFLYWLTDMRGKANWFSIIRPAGTNTLLCYLLPYFAYGLVTLLPFYLPALMLTGAVGLLKSFLFAFLIVLITGVLGKWGIKLKL